MFDLSFPTNHQTFAIAIPANNATANGNPANCGATLLQLARALGYTGPDVAMFRLADNQPGAGASSDRAVAIRAQRRPDAGLIAATDFTTHGEVVRGAVAYRSVSSDALANDFWRSSDTSAVPALLEISW